jgi:tRNA(Ile)-lysidine synthase
LAAVKSGAFNPDWLRQRLVTLLPSYPDVSLCVALSGGTDSVVLLASLARLARKRPRKRTRLRAVHIHHGLHPNANQWSEHCAALAKQLGVPLATLRVNVGWTRGLSVEAAAREARYAALAKVLEAGEVLLTAHHEDDQLETVLLQLMRGAGVAGLAAMPEVTPFARGTLARPLLTRSRAELEAWAKANDLAWVEDDTNANEQFDRNYLRRQILPLIRARWPSAARSVSRSARHAAEAKHLLDSLALADVERASNGASLSVQTLRALPPDRRRNAVRFWIARSGYPVPETKHLELITTALLDARPDANPTIAWNATQLRRHADHLSLEAVVATQAADPPEHLDAIELARVSATLVTGTVAATGTLAKSATPASNAEINWNWRASARIQLSDSRGTLEITSDPHGPLDLAALPATLTLRRRQGGERLRPKRGGRTRTLKALLQEARVPLAERAHLPLVFADGRLIAVADRWLDDSVQAEAATRNRGRIRWHRT